MAWEFKRQGETNIYHVYDTRAPLIPLGAFVYMYNTAAPVNFALYTPEEVMTAQADGHAAGYAQADGEHCG